MNLYPCFPSDRHRDTYGFDCTHPKNLLGNPVRIGKRIAEGRKKKDFGGDMKMSGKMLFGSMCIFVTFSIFGCAQTQNTAKTKTAQGAAIGAATGVVAGAVIGHQSGHKGRGAVIGGLTGAAIGGAVGYKLDKQAKELQQIPNTEVRVEEESLVVTMSDAILFDVNSAALKGGAQQTLNQMADVMNRYPDNTILVKGHTDNTGSERYNQDLSERRAVAVKNYLIVKGIAPGKITSLGFGMTMPVASNGTPAGRADNRRVEIEIKPGESQS
jgi:outer membrane protein OmpA-like peptidoglycan-associated protein